MQMTMTVPAADVWHFVRLLEAERAREMREGEESPPGKCQAEHEARVKAADRIMGRVAGLAPGDPLELTAGNAAERLMLANTADRMMAHVAERPGELDAADYTGLTDAADQVREWAERARLVNLQYEAAEAAERAGV